MDLNYDIAYAATGADMTITAYNTDTTTTTYRKAQTDWSIVPAVTHYFYYEPVEAVCFAFAPSIKLGVERTTGGGYTSQTVEVDKADVDSNGTYDASDTITTTTRSYYGNDDDSNHFDIVSGVRLPSALRVKMEKAPFEIVFGNELSLAYRGSFYSDSYNSTRTTIQVADGTGAVSSSTTTMEVTTEDNTRFEYDWTFENTFHFLLIFDLPADIKLAVNLNMQDLFDFEDLRAELTIPLK